MKPFNLHLLGHCAVFGIHILCVHQVAIYRLFDAENQRMEEG